MKGMQRIKRHKSFVNVVKYVLKSGSHHKRDPVVIGGNMTGDCANELIAEFNTASERRTDIAKPAWHNSLRLPKNDKLTNAQWIKIADDYMNQMGFSDTHLRCYVLHDDSVGQHIHIIANRIDSVSGRVNLGRHESLKSGRIIQELEIKYSLTITKGSEPLKPTDTGKETNKAIPQKSKKISRNEAMFEQRTGEICNKQRLQMLLDKSLADSPDVKTFLMRLEEAKVSCTANIAITGRMNGFSFEYVGIAFKASQLGKKYSWSNLQKLLNYEPERDNSQLLNTSTVSPAPASAAISKTSERRESISEKIAELELLFIEGRRNEIVEKILQRNAAQQQKLLRFVEWLSSLKQYIELLRSFGKTILHKTRTNFSKIYAMQPLNKARKIRL